MKELRLEIEALEERIAPNIPGQQGYEGHPGNQSSSNPSHNPVPAGSNPEPSGP